MTLSEFAKTLRTKHPGAYDDLDDNTLVNKVLTKFPQYKDMVDQSTNPDSMEFERGPNYPASTYTTDAPSMDIAMAAEAAPKLIMGIPAAIKAAPELAEAAGDGIGTVADAVKGGVGKVGEMVGDGWDALKNQITGNTPRAFGYAQNAGATPEARQLAKDSIDFANTPQTGLGDLVKGSDQTPGLVPAGTDMPPSPDVSSFQSPIKQGMFGGDPEQMLQTVKTQKDSVGQAISNTLGKYDSTDSFYDPSKVNDMVKGMLERDANGDVMTTGAQGKINEAMMNAVSSLKDFSQGAPISWSDAARIKTLMQGDASYGEAGLTRAQQAYDSVASMLKDDIDKQAGDMLQKVGSPEDVQKYQQLRQAYGKLSSLSDSLNVAAKRQFANNPVPWWVKMGAGAGAATALGAAGSKILHGLTGG